MQQTQPVKDPIDIKLSEPVLAPGQSYVSVTRKISEIVLMKNTPRGWYVGFGISFALLNVLMVRVGYLFVKGVGIWCLNNPVACFTETKSAACFACESAFWPSLIRLKN